MKHKPELAIISSDKRVKKYLMDTITQIIGHLVQIEGYSLDEGVKGPLHIPIVLTSGKFLLPKAKRIFPKSVIIPGRRVITGHNLEKVIMLPKNKKVLVVNHPKVASIETVESLINLGIDHLEYIPYWKGQQVDIKSIDTVITPGMLHLCPAGIKNKIDIGARTITFHTFLDLLLTLNLDIHYIDTFANQYMNLLMDASRKIGAILEESEMLRKKQEVILNEIEEGILSVDGNNIVSIANPAFYRIFGTDSHSLLNRNIKNFFNWFNKADVLINDKNEIKKSSDILLSYKGKHIICTKLPVVKGNEKQFIYTFKEVSEIQNLEGKVRRKLYEKGYVAKYTFNDIWGNNANMKAAKAKAEKFAKSEHTILITGETGTGKELFAQAIHQQSLRRDGPFLAINFAAIPENLVESELFGYEEGAFTGAKKGGKPGIFEQAHGGTILLDEIGDAPLNIQSRLLRVLQEREIMRVGGSKIIPVDVRVIAATNKNLADYVKQGLFRPDLFYRLNVLPIETPPLREFKTDIPVILNSYLNQKYGVNKTLSSEALHFLLEYNWPGNIRELINAADYIYYSSENNECIKLSDIPIYVKKAVETEHAAKGSNIFEDIISAIAEFGNIKEAFHLLNILKNRENLKTGRHTILKEMKKLGFPITEGSIRKYIKFMNYTGFIVIGKTKQGSRITTKGLKFIDYFESRQKSGLT